MLRCHYQGNHADRSLMVRLINLILWNLSPLWLISSLLIENTKAKTKAKIKAINYNVIYPSVTWFLLLLVHFITFFLYFFLAYFPYYILYFLFHCHWNNNNNKLSNSACWHVYPPERTESNSSTPTDNPLQIQLSPSRAALLRHRDPQTDAGESWI